MKKKTNISDKTLKLINQRQMRPIPRWEFVAKNWSIWLGFGGSLLLVVLGVALSWFGLIDNIITPYMWIVLALVFFGLSFFIFQKTKKAYRFDKKNVAVVLILVALMFGGILFRMGAASRIDRGMESRFSLYRQMVPMKMEAWNRPESGYLSGEITSLNDESGFVIKDFNGKEWTVFGDQMVVRGRVKMLVGEEIKIIGSQGSTNTFKADEIRPWNGMGQNMMKENR